MNKIFLSVLTVLSFALSACNKSSDPQNITTLTGPTMGTTFTIKIADPQASSKQQAVKTDVEQLLIHINQLMSTYIDDSELTLINQSKSTDWLSVSEELLNVLLEAKKISQLSDGAFDITVGPLVNLWGFGPNEVTKDMLPDEEVITNTMAIIGYEKIDYQSSKKVIRKQHEDIYIDLSAIAKGYAVDEVADLLDAYGFKNYMVDIGGELKPKGKRSDERGWRIGIEKPVVDRRSIQRVIEIDRIGMATSGDYRNFYEVDGVRYSHTINPRTGQPVAHKLASVTVLHESVMQADALATALNVLGPEDGVQLARNQGITAYFIVHDDEQYKEISTHNFEQYFVEKVK